ncbi:MAG: hypothetical protein QOG72_813 [Sphingomonadales bacterium]|jgi:hypothetical protein|nr:hypothetical protein [Sphingomonadales bacterium]
MHKPDSSGIEPVRVPEARQQVYGINESLALPCSRSDDPARMLTPINVDDIDMTGVDPLRLGEVRRRVAAVKSYLRIRQPTDHDRRRHARALGLSGNQFLALVRAWKEHGRAAAIAGAGTARGTPRSASARTLPTVSKDAAREVIAALGPDVPHVEAVRAVEARCASLGVKAPSKSTIWNMVMASRRNAASKHGSDDVLISRCHAKLPVEHEDQVIFPWIVLMVDGVNGAVIGAAMDEKWINSDSVASALAALPAERRIVVDQEIAKKIGGGKLPTHIAVRPTAARTATARALGRGFGSIELIYQLSRAVHPRRMLRSRRDTALNPRDARQLILEQLTAHNAARTAPPPIVDWEI